MTALDAAVAVTPFGRAVAAGKFVLRHWKLILSVIGFSLLSLKLLAAEGDARHWRKVADNCAAGRQHDQDTIRRKTAEAEAKQAVHVVTVERHDNAIQKEQSHVYETKRDVVRRYFAHGGVPRQPTGADQRVAGAVSGTEAAEPAAATEGAGGSAVVPQDDLRICAENTLKAQTWLEWWGKVEAEPR